MSASDTGKSKLETRMVMFKATDKWDEYKLLTLFISFKFSVQLPSVSQFPQVGKHQERRVGGGSSSRKRNCGKQRGPQR